jgi:hypothetical protein
MGNVSALKRQEYRFAGPTGIPNTVRVIDCCEVIFVVAVRVYGAFDSVRVAIRIDSRRTVPPEKARRKKSPELINRASLWIPCKFFQAIVFSFFFTREMSVPKTEAIVIANGFPAVSPDWASNQPQNIAPELSGN